MSTSEIVYIADPMCSWCWGFSPVAERMTATYGDRFPLRLVMGGLRPGATREMDAPMKAMISEHWEHVRDATGQPFDFDFFSRQSFVYDTEPSCRAVVAGRRQEPSRAQPLLRALQGAFYRDGRDVTDETVLVDIAAEVGFDRDTFATALCDDETRAATREDFAEAKSMGIRGYPALVAFHEDKRPAILTLGYTPWETVDGRVRHYFDDVS